jgi:hypothetical protein
MYQPVLPVTSGGVGVFGLAYGITTQNIPVLAIGLISLGLVIFYFARLRQGEAELEQEDFE